jgi:hypothetical protein
LLRASFPGGRPAASDMPPDVSAVHAACDELGLLKQARPHGACEDAAQTLRRSACVLSALR